VGTDRPCPGHCRSRAEGKDAARPSPWSTVSRSKQPAGGPKGYDAGKKVKGRKRHVAVDTLGLPIKCQVTSAEVQDRDALPDLLKAVSQKSPCVNSRLSMADVPVTQRAAYAASRIRITVLDRADCKVKGFIVLPKRWIVERTFGSVNRERPWQRTSRH
jgi:transposase